MVIVVNVASKCGLTPVNYTQLKVSESASKMSLKMMQNFRRFLTNTRTEVWPLLPFPAINLLIRYSSF